MLGFVAIHLNAYPWKLFAKETENLVGQKEMKPVLWLK